MLQSNVLRLLSIDLIWMIMFVVLSFAFLFILAVIGFTSLTHFLNCISLDGILILFYGHRTV